MHLNQTDNNQWGDKPVARKTHYGPAPSAERRTKMYNRLLRLSMPEHFGIDASRLLHRQTFHNPQRKMQCANPGCWRKPYLLYGYDGGGVVYCNSRCRRAHARKG